MVTATHESLPPELLQAVASRAGRVSMVLGAGCSIEAPTSLKLSWSYSVEANQVLIDDGVLEVNECAKPEDLSELASTVHAKCGKQEALVSRLPINEFRYAKANSGYLLAAALMLEGAIACIMTLNYDLALSDALKQLDAKTVDEIAGPDDFRYMGKTTVIYLHRNAHERDFEKWILRREALETEWRDGWEAVVVPKVIASPVVVFAGLGSPAAVLTDTAERIRKAIPNAMQPFLVDPKGDTEFAHALGISTDHQISLSWGEFMSALGRRMVREAVRDIQKACSSTDLRDAAICDDSTLATICACLESRDLVSVGRFRALWLDSEKAYLAAGPTENRLIGDLFQSLGALAQGDSISAAVTSEGLVQFTDSSGAVLSHVLLISGCGYKQWSTVEARLVARIEKMSTRPDQIILGGFSGYQIQDLVPPIDIVSGDMFDDVTQGLPLPEFTSTSAIRADPASYRLKVA